MAKPTRTATRPAAAGKPPKKTAGTPPPPPPAGAVAATATPVLRKKDLLERVALSSGTSRKDARAIVEATLQVLGEALARGETLVLPPLGKARVNRSIDKAGAELLVIKLRRETEGRPKKVEKSPPEGLAEAGDHV
jgi:hypothetical protein